MSRLVRAVLALCAAFAVGGAAVAVVPTSAGAAHATHAHPKKHKKKKPAKPPKPVTLAPGAVVRYYNVKVNPTRTVRSALLRLDLRNPRVRLGAAIPGNAVNSGRQTIATLTRLNRGVGGVNADFFKNDQPLGGLVIDGVMLKSPRRDWDANFYLRGGRAHIGPVNYTGTVTRAARPAADPTPQPSQPSPGPPSSSPAPSPGPISLPIPILFPPSPDPSPTPSPSPSPGPSPNPSKPTPASTRTLTSVNALRDLGDDRLVLVNSALATPRFGRSCAVATASSNRTGSGMVTAVHASTTAIARRKGAEFALVACGKGPRATWLRTQVRVGDTLSTRSALSGGTPSTLVSGGRVLVRNGRGFDDRDGKTITGRNPETFGCVSRDGAKVLLGTIDGRREGSSGVTLPELTRYLLRLRCWSGIVFDGGGSSTLVGRPLGHPGVRVLNRPSDTGGARAVTTGLLVYRR